MNSLSRETRSLAAVEACNARKAEAFQALPEDIEVWRFREVLMKLGPELSLSDGAVLYALDLLGLLTEADWRGDGRAVTFHSIRAYARKVGRAERSISRYESQLIRAGLGCRTVKHARRHGGYGDEKRRTGFDWRPFGAAMPELLERLKHREAYEQRRLDIEARIRSERGIVLGLIEMMEEGRAAVIIERLSALKVLRLPGESTVEVLQARLSDLMLLRGEIEDELRHTGPLRDDAQAVDKSSFSTQESDQSDSSVVLINTTNHPSCLLDIRDVTMRPSPDGDDSISSERPNGRIGFETKPYGQRSARTPKRRAGGDCSAVEGQGGLDAIPLPEIWKAAPEGWKSALGCEVDISWPVLIDLAQHFAPRLGVSPYAWNRALRVLGPSDAALALMVLDRNRDHPMRPVMSVGGALVGMTRRAEEGDFNLTPSIYGIMSRYEGGAGRKAQGAPRRWRSEGQDVGLSRRLQASE